VKIDIVHPGYPRVTAGDLERTGLGGNETAMVLASRLLAARGHRVSSPVGALPGRVTHGVTGYRIDGDPPIPPSPGSSWTGSGCSPRALPAGKGWRKQPATSPPPMTSPRSSSRYGKMPAPGSWQPDPATPLRDRSSPACHPGTAAGNRLDPFTVRASTVTKRSSHAAGSR